ncbi:hypothetical protein QBC44DRAFT_305576 [Cladorrhinum sp. PSN332]|nr:hypothetical protein QBC44DRAFT_305576 [Cladorrhinum sp. PSN332]
MDSRQMDVMNFENFAEVGDGRKEEERKWVRGWGNLGCGCQEMVGKHAHPNVEARAPGKGTKHQAAAISIQVGRKCRIEVSKTLHEWQPSAGLGSGICMNAAALELASTHPPPPPPPTLPQDPRSNGLRHTPPPPTTPSTLPLVGARRNTICAHAHLQRTSACCVHRCNMDGVTGVHLSLFFFPSTIPSRNPAHPSFAYCKLRPIKSPVIARNIKPACLSLMYLPAVAVSCHFSRWQAAVGTTAGCSLDVLPVLVSSLGTAPLPPRSLEPACLGWGQGSRQRLDVHPP